MNIIIDIIHHPFVIPLTTSEGFLHTSILVTALPAAMTSALPTAAQTLSWAGVGNKLRISMDGAAAEAIWVSGTKLPGFENSTLGTRVALRNVPNGWMETAYVLKNNTPVKVIAFSNASCTNGLRRERRMTVPDADGLSFANFRLY
jgi:hypothetical protein